MTKLNELTKLVEDGHSFYYSDKFKGGLVYRAIAKHLLKNDVRIQKHGHWVRTNRESKVGGWLMTVCSVCGKECGSDNDRGYYDLSKYCHCCGAMMDEEGDCV